MKNIIINILLILLGVGVAAQNNFVYVRYDNAKGNPSIIVGQVNKVISETKGDFVIFYSNGDTPIICEKAEEWEELRNLILTQQNPSVFYPEDEFFAVNNLFTKYFKETVTVGTSLSINGKEDSKWTCTFILSQEILREESSSDYYSRLFSVNQLFDRMGVNVYSYNDEGIALVEYVHFNKHGLFVYY